MLWLFLSCKFLSILLLSITPRFSQRDKLLVEVTLPGDIVKIPQDLLRHGRVSVLKMKE